MAILDRPLFQRRLTKDQLRAYGIPAFANGGIVNMSNGGLPFLADRTDTAIPPPQRTDLSNIPSGTVISRKIIERDGKQIEVTETVIDGARGIKVIQKDERIVYEPETIVKTPRGEKVIPAKGEEQELGEVDIKKDETKVDVEETQVKDTDEVEDDIEKEKSELDRLKTLALERSDLYKQMLGDPKEMMKQQGLLQLAQFGLNLASARGGNLAEKIAKSAQDPLTAFAQLASDASKDARAIDLAAIKSAEDQLQTEIEIAGKTDELEKVLLYTKAKESNPGNPAGAATTTGILPQSELSDIDSFRDDNNKISVKKINQGGGANLVYNDEEGNAYKIKPGALQNKKFLTFPTDFEKLNVEILNTR
jgi:hypothetical protein